ncbi:5457_t:CDS:2 [Entrophospora sp. SA101]|nr:5457_t:CDS:2 [Entrophospora sp. SA101]CAJ0833169.1 6528_t:CDS:2 [Entrophospora sp. SA101]CAJ0840932.1 18630_t:CDS:2 [Entrophospora sp. SA101]
MTTSSDNTFKKQQIILFTQVKPICTSLMQARFQTPLNLQDIIQKIILLDKTIQNTPNFFIISDYKLIEYITLPLFELYSVKELSKCDRFLEEYLNCLSTLLLSGWQKFINSDNFLQLFIMFMKIIDGISDESSSTNDEKQQQQLQQINMNKKNSVKNQMISENTKLACVKYLLALLPKPSDQNKYKVSQEEYFKILQYRESILDDMRGKSVLNALVGRCVYVLLEYVVEERLLELRVTTLETIKNLIICVNNPAIVAVYLPGVVSKLSTLIVIEQKENHLLLEKAVETLAEVISIVMLDDDTINKGLISKNESISELKKVIINDNFNNGGFICVERNLSWLKATKSQIKISIANTLTIRNHPSWKLRLAFVNFSYNLLSKCSKTLDNCVPLLVETLVTYLNDEYEQVSCLCQIHLATLHNDSKIKDSLKLIMKESFNTWLTSLPRYLTGLDENAKYNVLSLLSGFILFLGSDIQGVLNLTLERISDGLLKALEFDICNTNIIEDFIKFHPQILFIINELLLGSAGINLKTNLNDLIVMTPANKLEEIKNVASSLLREYIELDAINNNSGSSGNGVNNTLNLNELVKADKHVDLLKSKTKNEIIQDYLLRNNSTNGNSSEIYELSIEFQNTIILINCMVLKGIAYISQIMKIDFRFELIDALYLILEKMGNKNFMIHDTAETTLSNVSSCCGYNSKKSLIFENIDYLINIISKKLNQITLNPQTPQVLIAMLKIVGAPLLAYLDDTIEEIFDALDMFHMNELILGQLLTSLYTIVSIISDNDNENYLKEEGEKDKEINGNNKSDNHNVSFEIQEFIKNYNFYEKKGNSATKSQENLTLDEIGRYFLERQKEKNDNDLEGESESGGLEQLEEIVKQEEENLKDSHDNKNNNDSGNKSLTHSQTFCLKIIDKSFHILASPSPRLRKLILDIIRISLPVLKSNPQKMETLVHQIWPSIVNRMKMENMTVTTITNKKEESYVILSAVELVQTISICCGEFFTSRVVNDVWPIFKKLLQQQSLIDQEYSELMKSTFSNSHYLKISILSTIKVIINQVKLSNEILCDIIDTMWIFLSDQFHEEIQELAKDLFIELSFKSPDATWLLLHGIVKDHSKIIYHYKEKSSNDSSVVLLDDIDFPDYFTKSSNNKNNFSKNANYILKLIQ